MAYNELIKEWGGEEPSRSKDSQSNMDCCNFMDKYLFDERCREDADFKGRAAGKGQFLFTGERPYGPARIFELGGNQNGQE